MLCKYDNYRRNYASRLSPALNGSSEIRHFERSGAIEIRDGIIFDFYTGLPHVLELKKEYKLAVSFHSVYVEGFHLRHRTLSASSNCYLGVQL